MTFRVEKNITGFEVSMYELAWMHVFEGFKKLVDNEFFVNLLKDACSDDDM